MRPTLLAFACLLLTLFVQPIAAADPPHPPKPSDLRPDILYTTKGEFVQVRPMHALTLNAHVEQFCYDPLGIEIAYVGSETQGDQTVHFVKTVDARTGHELSHLRMTAPQDDTNTNFNLLGWSVSGKYLLLQRFTPDPQLAETAITEYLRWDLSTSPPTTHVIAPEAHLPVGLQPADGSGDGIISPDRHWIVFQQHFQRHDTDGKPEFPGTEFLLYDPELDTFRSLILQPKTLTFGWSDNIHLDIWQEGSRKRFDVVTGEIRPHTPSSDAPDPPPASKHYPDLTLDTEFREQDDAQGSGGFLDSTLLWVRRTPFTKQPLGAAAAGILPRQHHSLGEVNGDDPQAVWSPTGRQIAFIANSELCVTDLTTVTDLLPHEKMAMGLKLSCAEERMLAMMNLKQIGLGIIQYCQDNDEKFPAAEGFTDTIYPYIKSREVFSVGSHNVVYEPPSDLALAKMEDPANTEMAFIDLPCARVVLMGDGHVKSLPKAGNDGGSGE